MFAGTGPPFAVITPPHLLPLRVLSRKCRYSPARLEVVTARRIVGKSEIVVERVDVLIAVARQVVVAVNEKPLNVMLGTVRRDAVRRCQ